MTPTDTNKGKVEKVNVLGMELEQWTYESCTATFAAPEGEDFATLYDIQSKDEGKGHATALLEAAKKHYEGLGKKFGGTIALNDRMRRIYQRLGIKEYA